MKNKNTMILGLLGGIIVAAITALILKNQEEEFPADYSSVSYGDIRDYYADMLDRLNEQLQELETEDERTVTR